MITFHEDTSEKVQRAVINAKSTGHRVRVWYGDTTTGKAWPEEHDIMGYVGNSTGAIKAPLLVHSKRSMGGPAMLDHCIVRIDTTEGATLYKHPTFDAGHWLTYGETVDGKDYATVTHNGETHAHFDDTVKAVKYIQFMRGERYSK